VMIDAVFNHAGYFHPAFIDVREKGKKSKYYHWFHIIDEEGPTLKYDTFGFFKHMPKFDTSNKEVQTHLLEVACYWVREFDVDGWRLDVANEVDHFFWRKFCRAVRKIKPDLYILGEIWHDAFTWLGGDQFDASMNYQFTELAIDFFAFSKFSPKEFTGKITRLIHRYPVTVNALAFNLLSSHDTARVLHVANGDERKVKLLYLFFLSFVGTPCIYYGDEIGMTGGPDPGCRRCMEWDRSKWNMSMFKFMQQLIALRKTVPGFSKGGFRFIGNAIREDSEDIVDLAHLNAGVIVYEKRTGEAPTYDESEITSEDDFTRLLFLLSTSEHQTDISFRYKFPPPNSAKKHITMKTLLMSENQTEAIITHPSSYNVISARMQPLGFLILHLTAS